jgi:hypothetical protein
MFIKRIKSNSFLKPRYNLPREHKRCRSAFFTARRVSCNILSNAACCSNSVLNLRKEAFVSSPSKYSWLQCQCTTFFFDRRQGYYTKQGTDADLLQRNLAAEACTTQLLKRQSFFCISSVLWLTDHSLKAMLDWTARCNEKRYSNW